MEFLKLLFTFYGYLLIYLRKLEYLYPQVRKVICKDEKNIYNITFSFYIISVLLYLSNYFKKICNYLIKLFDKEIKKTKIDFCVDNNCHSIILTKGKSITEIVNIFNNFIKDYENNKSTICYNSYCCKMSNVIIKSENKLIKTYDFTFTKEIIRKFRGVDSEFNNFCIKKEEYGISNKLIDVLDMHGCIHEIDYIEITKIPPIIKNKFDKESIGILELHQIDN